MPTSQCGVGGTNLENTFLCAYDNNDDMVATDNGVTGGAPGPYTQTGTVTGLDDGYFGEAPQLDSVLHAEWVAKDLAEALTGFDLAAYDDIGTPNKGDPTVSGPANGFALTSWEGVSSNGQGQVQTAEDNDNDINVENYNYFNNNELDWSQALVWAHATGFGVADAAVVPVPAAVWLFGTGLVGLIGAQRRKKTGFVA